MFQKLHNCSQYHRNCLSKTWFQVRLGEWLNKVDNFKKYAIIKFTKTFLALFPNHYFDFFIGCFIKWKWSSSRLSVVTTLGICPIPELRYSSDYFYANDSQIYISFSEQKIPQPNLRQTSDLKSILCIYKQFCLSINSSKSA